jgi:hypothetical protein
LPRFEAAPHPAQERAEAVLSAVAHQATVELFPVVAELRVVAHPAVRQVAGGAVVVLEVVGQARRLT